jgi:hypothetical protein
VCRRGLKGLSKFRKTLATNLTRWKRTGHGSITARFLRSNRTSRPNGVWSRPFSSVGAKRAAYILAQSQFFPQLHSLLLFIGQFLPVVLQFGLSAAKPTVQIAAAKIENKIFM